MLAGPTGSVGESWGRCRDAFRPDQRRTGKRGRCSLATGETDGAARPLRPSHKRAGGAKELGRGDLCSSPKPSGRVGRSGRAGVGCPGPQSPRSPLAQWPRRSRPSHRVGFGRRGRTWARGFGLTGLELVSIRDSGWARGRSGRDAREEGTRCERLSGDSPARETKSSQRAR